MSEREGKTSKGWRGLLIAVTAVALGGCFLWLGFCELFAMDEKSCTVVEDIPNSEDQLVIEEYVGMRSGSICFSLRRPWHVDKVVGRADFNERYCPIDNGNYELFWGNGTVTVRYAFSTESRENWAELSLDLSA